MKKIFILFCLIAIIVTNGKTQTRIAIKAGANYSTARAYFKGEKQAIGYKPGFNIGMQADIPFEEGLHFTPFVSYSMKGYTISPTSGAITKIDNTIHYIDLSPKLSYLFSQEKSSSFVIGAGMVMGVAVAGTEKTTKNGVISKQKMEFDMTGEYGYFDFSFTPSIGYSSKKYFIEAAYQLGLTNINNNAEFDFRNIRNRTFSLNFGYYIR